MLRTKYVTLKVVYDDSNAVDPKDWDWNELIGINTYDEFVELYSATDFPPKKIFGDSKNS